MNEFLSWLLDAVQSVDPVARTIAAGVAVMLETSVLIGLIVPGDMVVIVAATAVATPLEGVFLGIAVVIGALIGESIGFWLGRFLGPKIRHSKLGQRLGDDKWERSERYLRRRGGPAIFISRFLPVLHSLVPLTVGMSEYPYRRFLAWTTPACIVWATLYISVASAAAGTYRELADQLHYAGYIFVAAIVVFILLVFLGKKLLEKLEHRHLHEEEREHAQDTLPTGRVQEDMED
ncbi:DedA family protein [Microbacterium sp. NPDC019599]|uniref:DedA family protein n=1 Tax=Microbacterium sp. NPDC019599 TaxID=3154690 RepID=UPI0033CB08AD